MNDDLMTDCASTPDSNQTNRKTTMRNANDDRISYDYEKPPYSRLFVVCSKQHSKADLMPLFEKYGQVDDLYMPKDRHTGQSKGIAFVKYSKTSSAATAIEELHKTCIEKDGKPIKVMVSSSKGEELHTNEDKFKRLFIKVSRNATEDEIHEHFSKFGRVSSIHLQKDKSSADQCKGFAYVNYHTFGDAAKAFEQCDTKYKPIFATPKEELKRPRISDEFDMHHNQNNHALKSWRDNAYNNRASYPKPDYNKRDSISSLINTKSQNFNTINVSCNPGVPQKCIESLFKIIPGLLNFRFTSEINTCKVVIKYETEVAAAHALETLNKYEFPSGEVLTITPVDNPLSQAANNLSEIMNSFKNIKDTSPDMLQLAEAIAQASSLIKAATVKDEHPNSSNDFEYVCGVKLPLIKPLASVTSKVEQRCFLVLKPEPPPQHVLQNIFCRFGDLIDVSIFLNKTFGFAKYASAKAAKDAIANLHGVTLYGIKFKVIEADDNPPKEERLDVDDEEGRPARMNHVMERKRPKLTINLNEKI